jgi:hypothetical protein
MATVLADTIAQNHNLNERLQKQLATKVERCIRDRPTYEIVRWLGRPDAASSEGMRVYKDLEGSEVAAPGARTFGTSPSGYTPGPVVHIEAGGPALGATSASSQYICTELYS